MSGRLTSVHRNRPRTAGGILVVVLVLALFWGGRVAFGPRDLHLDARFTRSVGLYQGDQVRILGVPVGEVTRIRYSGSAAIVSMKIRPGVRVPASASAVVIAPSLVSGRNVQLTPVYRTGPEMRSGAVIPLDRTQVPVEFDELKGALTRFARDLGPDEPGKKGPLGEALDTGAANLAGQGRTMHDTLTRLSAAVSTLSAGRGDIFSTVRDLAAFTSSLAQTDEQMRAFARQSAVLSEDLSDNRVQLATAVDRLNRLMPRLQRYLRENRPLLRQAVGDLGRTTDTLAGSRQDLADALQVAPNALANFYNVYDPRTASLTGGLVLPYAPKSPQQVLCYLLRRNSAAPACAALQGALDAAVPRTGPSAGLGSLLAPGGSR